MRAISSPLTVMSGVMVLAAALLRLDQPLCVVGTDDPLNPAQAGVERVQLVFKSHEAYKRYRALMGRKAIATGTLYGAQTAHHKTPLLISVADLAAAAQKLR